MSDVPPTGSNPLHSLPGLVRVVAGSGWRIVEWSVGSSLDATGRTIRALAAGESPTRILATATTELRAAAGRLLRSGDGEVGAGDGPAADDAGATPEELRARGAELLARSADVRYGARTHPAYARILDQLAPDEARVLRFLVLEGPQPSVDVRTSRPMGVGSELVASGLSMIGLQAGVREVDRTHAYLNNLYRLGLVWFSREQLDPATYQVVEVQPEVAAAIKRAGRAAKTVRRSIHLTPFGEDFCVTCLPVGRDADGA